MKDENYTEDFNEEDDNYYDDLEYDEISQQEIFEMKKMAYFLICQAERNIYEL